MPSLVCDALQLTLCRLHNPSLKFEAKRSCATDSLQRICEASVQRREKRRIRLGRDAGDQLLECPRDYIMREGPASFTAQQQHRDQPDRPSDTHDDEGEMRTYIADASRTPSW